MGTKLKKKHISSKCMRKGRSDEEFEHSVLSLSDSNHENNLEGETFCDPSLTEEEIQYLNNTPLEGEYDRKTVI